MISLRPHSSIARQGISAGNVPKGGPNQNENTLFFLSHAWPEVDTVRPDIDGPSGAQVAPLPAIVLSPPIGLKPRYRRRRQSCSIGSKQGGERFLELTRRNALEVEPGQ